MRICFFCDSIFTFGGVQRVLAVVAKALSAHHEITILTMDNPSLEDKTMYGLSSSAINIQYFEYPRLPIYKILPHKIYSFLYKKLPIKNKFTSKLYSRSSYPTAYRKLLASELNAGNYDVVVGVHAFIGLRLAIIRHNLQSPKVIGWMHNSYEAFFNNPGVFLWEQKEQFQNEMPKLDKVIVLSNSDKDRYDKEMNLETIVIPNPLTLKPLGKGNESFKSFLAVGRLTHAKGFDLLIESFARFSKNNDDWVLNIVGEGSEKDALVDLISRKNLNERIFIHPFTKNIQQYYSSNSVFVLSSRWEGWGLVMCEAMAHGLPVIASDLPVVKELLENSGNTLIFKSESIDDLTEKLNRIIDMDLDSMSEISIEVSKRFSLPVVISQWENIFSDQ